MKDYYNQADQHRAFLKGLEGKENSGRFIFGSFLLDDAVDPQVPAKIRISPSLRNKPAEELVGKLLSSG